MIVMGVDPGAQHAGWCVMDKNKIITLGVATGDSAGRLLTAIGLWRGKIDVLVVERMQAYPQSPVPVGDLLDVQFTGGFIAGAIAPKVLLTPRPREWKGTIPKDIHHRRITASLSYEATDMLAEIQKSIRHNALDAVGLAQWGKTQHDGTTNKIRSR